MRLAVAWGLGLVIGWGWFLAGGAECDRADCGWFQALLYNTWPLGFVLMIVSFCGLVVATIRRVLSWHRDRGETASNH